MNSQECWDLSTIIDTCYIHTPNFRTWWQFYHEIWSEQYFPAWRTHVRTHVRTYVRTSSQLGVSAPLEQNTILVPSDSTLFLKILILCSHDIPVGDFAPKEHLRPTGMMFVRACVRAYVCTYVALENIVHSISRGRTVTKCWNLVCVCNKYQWWYPDFNIPGNYQQLQFLEFSIFFVGIWLF